MGKEACKQILEIQKKALKEINTGDKDEWVCFT
jgi:hypothetical protein